MNPIGNLLFDRDDQAARPGRIAWGLLALRVGAGACMIGHGWSKLLRFGELAGKFADPLGVGSAASLSLTVFAEFGCALLVIFGLGTRLAVLPILITMLVAAFVIHGDDPWSKKEFPLLYAVVWFALFLAGPGRYSLDYVLSRRRS
jgi:putative oxidoreductase